MEGLEVFATLIFCLVALFIGIVLGGTISDFDREREIKKKQKAIDTYLKDPNTRIGASEAFLCGFRDAEEGVPGRFQEFNNLSFECRYRDGYQAAEAKRIAEHFVLRRSKGEVDG